MMYLFPYLLLYLGFGMSVSPGWTPSSHTLSDAFTNQTLILSIMGRKTFLFLEWNKATIWAVNGFVFVTVLKSWSEQKRWDNRFTLWIFGWGDASLCCPEPCPTQIAVPMICIKQFEQTKKQMSLVLIRVIRKWDSWWLGAATTLPSDFNC